MPLKTNLKNNKFHMKPKLSFAKSRNDGEGFDDMDSKRNENGAERNKRRVNTRGNSGDNVGFESSGRRDERKVHWSEGFRSNNGKRGGKLRTMDGRKERNDKEQNEGFRSNSGENGAKLRTKGYVKKENDENNGNEGFKSRFSGKKRKMDYNERSSGNEEKPNWESLLKVAGTKIKEYVGPRKQTFKSKFQNSEESDVENEMGEGKKNSRGLRKIKSRDKVEDTGISKRPERRKQLDQNKNKGVEDLKRSMKKKIQGKKSTANKEVVEKPKKKKRVIRIDPNDGSNKRINDAIDGEEKKKEVQKTNNAELSLNAQFRAICPSPSILTFVEENLLGRRREIEIKRAGYNIELPSPLDNIPFSSSSERERIEEPAFRNKLEFFAAAKVSSSFPIHDLPEIAFAGRSNVGKSSLLNSLTRQWGVVRTSDKPGLTQTINFFKLEPKICLVDLPGYGFAYAKEEVKESWEELVKEYVSDRVGLKRVCLLVDTKWGMKPRDYDLVDLMERYQTKYQIVLTKTDLVFPIDVARRAMQIEESLKQKRSAVQPVMMVSSKSGAGIGSLRTALAKIARFVKP